MTWDETEKTEVLFNLVKKIFFLNIFKMYLVTH